MKSKKSSKRRLAEAEAQEREDSEDTESKGKEKSKGYSADNDKCVREIGKVEGDGGRGGDIVVRLMSYNNGPIKIAVGMCGEKKDGSQWFAKLGRITGDQCEALIPLLKKAKRRLAKINSRKKEKED